MEPPPTRPYQTPHDKSNRSWLSSASVIPLSLQARQTLAGLPRQAQKASCQACQQWTQTFHGVLGPVTGAPSQAALSLVAAGIGICVVSEDCAQPMAGVRYVPVQNWHQALYMCILYDKWLEPPVWGFVEQLIKTIRTLYPNAQ